MGSRVEVKVENYVAEVLLNRPAKFNALDMAFFEQLADVGEELKTREDVRVVILSGAGDNFCAGIDLASLQGELSQPGVFEQKAFTLPDGEVANFFQKPVHVWQQLRVPVIAVLQGVAFGGGCQIALAADIRFAAPSTRLSIMEIKWGIIPDMGISQSLQKLVRDDVARELVYTGREVGAAEAHALGLLTHLSDDPLSDARQMAATIAAKNPDAIAACKTLLDAVPQLPVAEGLKLEATLQATVLGRPNQLEAVQANFEKRAPVFN